jgi:hypothetical protein
MKMDALASILEEEFALAFEVKDEKALHRSLTLLTGGMVEKSVYERDQNTLSSDVKLLTVEMKEGFKRMDERFLAQDKRFESFELRFNRLTGVISLGFLVLTALITVFQFLS